MVLTLRDRNKGRKESIARKAKRAGEDDDGRDTEEVEQEKSCSVEERNGDVQDDDEDDKGSKEVREGQEEKEKRKSKAVKGQFVGLPSCGSKSTKSRSILTSASA
jgi:hypothetical protein